MFVKNDNTKFSKAILNSSQNYEMEYANALDEKIKKELKIISIFHELRIFSSQTVSKNKNHKVIFSEELGKD